MKRSCELRMSSRVLWVGLLCVVSSCAILEEGCLDVYATNFAVDVDKGCSACCTYPQIRIDLLHKIQVGDSLQNITPETVDYSDGAGHSFRIQDIRFYVSGIHLLRSDGMEVGVEEMIALKKADGSTVTVENNFGLWTPSSLARFIPGTFKKADEITAVRLTLGVGQSISGTMPESAPTTHVLFPKTIPMWTASAGYTTQRVAIYPDNAVSGNSPIVYETTGLNAMRTIELPLPQAMKVAPGYHVNIVIQLDYSAWFASMDIQKDTSESMVSKFRDGFVKSIRVIQATSSEG